MKKQRLLLAIVLFLLGLAGILSLLTIEFPIPEEALKLLLEKFTMLQIKLFSLINPTILVIGAILTGVFLHDKVSLNVPVIKGVINRDRNYKAIPILKYGVSGGIIAGILILLAGMVYKAYLPKEFTELGENLKLSLAARFLYGGITEEILLRFGLMTLIVWVIFKIFKTLNSKIYWTGIIIASLFFAVGHLPVVYQAVGKPSGLLLSYIIIGNSIGGIVFGWLYWKKGLEAAFIAHIFVHVIMVSAESIF